MFDILPPWLSDIFVLVAVVAGPSGLIWSILNQKGANRKLVVDESGLEVTEFNSLTSAYKDLYITARNTAEEALAELHRYKEEFDTLRADVDEMRDFQKRRDTLFLSVVRRNQIVLTAEENDEFEATKPRRVPRSTGKKV